jgi:hypothetical protein
MSNERRNPYYKKKNHKNMSSLAAATVGTRAAAARASDDHGSSSLTRAIEQEAGNEMNLSIECDTNVTTGDMNESMISTASSINPQDLDSVPTGPTLVQPPQTTPTHTITNQLNTNLMNKETPMTTTINNTANGTPNTQINNITTRTLLVNNESPANPNDVETFALRIRQQSMGTRLRSAPITPLVSQPYTHIGYFDIKVKLERSDDPWDELIGVTKEVMGQLWKADSSIKVFAYEKAERTGNPAFIANVADFRKINFFNFDKFFYRGAPLPLGGSRTLNVLMTYTSDFNNIMRQIGPIMLGMQCGVYMRTLQAEKTTTIGWAYMSTKHTNKQALAEAITKKIQIPIGLQWRVVTTGMAGVMVKEEDKVRAIHFEVEDCDVQYAKRTLNELYHHSQTEGFPLEMKFRFMPLYSSIPNTEGQNSFMTMLGFQRRYCRYMGEYLSGDIVNVEGLLPNGITIRQYLMNIRVDEDRRKRLFLGINKTWNNRGYVYSVLPKHRDLASVTIQHLLTKLHFDFPGASEDGKVFPDIDKFFDAVAWERSQETAWDAQRNCAVAINMDNLQGTLDAMKGEDFFETFDEQYEDKMDVEKKGKADDDTVDKEKLMIDSDGKSIATRTRTSRRSEITSNKGTPGSGARVSFGDSVASPITVEGTTAGSVLTMADVQSIVTSTVLPMVAKEVATQFGQYQENMNGSLSSVFQQMQDNLSKIQQQQQQQQQQHQQFQLQQQQQFQQQQQQMQQFQQQQQQQQQMFQQQLQQQQQQQQQQPQYSFEQQHDQYVQEIHLMDTGITDQQQQQLHQQQAHTLHHEFSAAHSMESEQPPS